MSNFATIEVRQGSDCAIRIFTALDNVSRPIGKANTVKMAVGMVQLYRQASG